MKFKALSYFRLFFLLLMIFVSQALSAQGLLDKNISVQFVNLRLENALEIISNKGSFYFSYNSNIIKRDSIINLTISNRSVKQVLDLIFNGRYEYRESGNYIIIRRAPVALPLITSEASTDDNVYTVSGYVLDDESGERIRQASVYEKERLISTLTDDEGYFKLKLKSKSGYAALTVSKQFYKDTTVVIKPKYDQEVRITIIPEVFSGKMITISPQDMMMPDSITIEVQMDSSVTRYLYLKADSMLVEKTAAAKFLLSAKQQIQSLNLKGFYADRPFHASVIPGVSSHGKLSPQIINNFSLNLFGGYSGGVNGIEVGGLFNIDKKHVQFIQAGGIFNIVGGYVHGIQVAGIHNLVLDEVAGLQVAGINNMVKKNFYGGQFSGIYNHVSGRVSGLQFAGVSNYARAKMNGAQISGIGNFSNREMNGAQISGFFNYAKHMKGLQIGLINVSNTTDGCSIGLINIVFKGYHKLTFTTNEVLNTNVSIKTGTSHFYNIFLGGMNAGKEEKLYSFGYGLGTRLGLGKAFALDPEITTQYMYLGSWENLNLLGKVHLNLNLRIGKYFSIFAGPSVAGYYSDQKIPVEGYAYKVPPPHIKTFTFNKDVIGWIGWNAGINIF